jgi:hypothetical protein
MNTHCPVCDVSLEPEPGFYYGAMFVSYAFTVVLFAITAGIIYFFFSPATELTYIIAIIVVSILFVPFSFRYSRICFLYLIGGIKYDPTIS